VTAARKVCLGVIVGAHGIRGEVRVKSFTGREADIASYGELSDESGSRLFRLRLTGQARGALLARIAGVSDRNAAEALRGLRLYVDRTALPQTQADEYYHADLIGLAVLTAEGHVLGRVSAVHNHGAGDLLEIEGADRRSTLVPFQKAFLESIEPQQGRIVLSPAAAEFAPPRSTPGAEQPGAGGSLQE
jgi:16S rRNA processing protein RimM